MQSMWIYWLLVFFLRKSTGFADVELSVVNVTETSYDQGLDLQNPYSHCPINPSAHGIYTIQVGVLEPFEVSCDAKIAGPGWTVIARRTNGDLNFFRSWEEYKGGFGDITGDFFIGLDKLHGISKAQAQELYVHLEDFEGNTRYAQYDEFYIESENEFYRMSKLGAFTGDAGDSMRDNQNQNFTTYDRDNDAWEEKNCAVEYMGPWWYTYCTYSNLFGLYLNGTVDNMQWKGVMWYGWREEAYSYKEMQMMVRPKCSCSIKE